MEGVEGTGDLFAEYVLEQFIPVTSFMWTRSCSSERSASRSESYRTPPMAVAHEGGTLRRERSRRPTRSRTRCWRRTHASSTASG